MHARSIYIELPAAKIEAVRSFALELLNPDPEMGSASLAPNDAARTRLKTRTQNDAIRDMAKGIAAQLAISKCGQKRPKAIRAVPVCTAVGCAERPKAHSASVKSLGKASCARAYCARVVLVHIVDLQKFVTKTP